MSEQDSGQRRRLRRPLSFRPGAYHPVSIKYLVILLLTLLLTLWAFIYFRRVASGQIESPLLRDMFSPQPRADGDSASPPSEPSP
jgi:hypothetical protein